MPARVVREDGERLDVSYEFLTREQLRDQAGKPLAVRIPGEFCGTTPDLFIHLHETFAMSRAPL